MIRYAIATWRCRLFGHKWGPERHDYDPNVGTKMESWQECMRPGCCGYHETYHYLVGPSDRVFG